MSEEKEPPVVLHLVMKPVLERLKHWLRETQGNYTRHVTGSDGCDTCGYGASEHLELDMDELEREIDTFSEMLKNEHRK